MLTKHLFRFTFAALVALGLIGLGTTGNLMAQSDAPTEPPTTQPPNPAPKPDDVRTMAAWDNFLDQHPDTAKALQKNPSLLDNAKFLSKNPALKEFFKDHPDFATAAGKNPQRLMSATQRFDKSVEPGLREARRDALPRPVVRPPARPIMPAVRASAHRH